MRRPTLDSVLLRIATMLSTRSTCAKLSVGCVLTDKKGRILATGYNGVPRGCEHCTEVPCPGAFEPKGADLCRAVHAEQNAMLQCREPDNIYKCYVTHVPCMRCTKQLLNTGCQTIVFGTAVFAEFPAMDLWTSAGRSYEALSPELTYEEADS